MSSINPLTIFHKRTIFILAAPWWLYRSSHLPQPIRANPLSVAFSLQHSETPCPIWRLSPDGISRIVLIPCWVYSQRILTASNLATTTHQLFSTSPVAPWASSISLVPYLWRTRTANLVLLTLTLEGIQTILWRFGHCGSQSSPFENEKCQFQF